MGLQIHGGSFQALQTQWKCHSQIWGLRGRKGNSSPEKKWKMVECDRLAPQRRKDEHKSHEPLIAFVTKKESYSYKKTIICRNDKSNLLLAFFHSELGRIQHDMHEPHNGHILGPYLPLMYRHSCSRESPSMTILLHRRKSLRQSQVFSVRQWTPRLWTRKTSPLLCSKGTCWKSRTNFQHSQSRKYVCTLTGIFSWFDPDISRIDSIPVTLIFLGAFASQELALSLPLTLAFSWLLKVFLICLWHGHRKNFCCWKKERQMMTPYFQSNFLGLPFQRVFLSSPCRESCWGSWQICCWNRFYRSSFGKFSKNYKGNPYLSAGLNRI